MSAAGQAQRSIGTLRDSRARGRAEGWDGREQLAEGGRGWAREVRVAVAAPALSSRTGGREAGVAGVRARARDSRGLVKCRRQWRTGLEAC